MCKVRVPEWPHTFVGVINFSWLKSLERIDVGLLRQLLRQARTMPAKQTATRGLGVLISKEANGPEAYADRIKRDFHLHDYADAWSLYASDPAYWEKRYGPALKPNPGNDIVHDSVRAAGIPSRYNVFE